jgi:hypothetical protein
MTSRNLFLIILSILLMSDAALAGMGPIHRRGEVMREREDRQRRREERDRERRETDNRRPQPRPGPLPLPSPVDPDMIIDMPQYGGNGCPQNSVALVRSPDSKALSVLFDQFIYDAASESGRAGNSKCQLQIPIRIRNGSYRLKILAVDLRGAVQIDNVGVHAVIRARSWLNAPRLNGRMPNPWAVERQNFHGPIDESFTITLEGNENSRIFTGCTDSFILNVSTEIALRAGRNSADSGLIAIDSLDQDVQQGGLVYQLGWEMCR